jgi:hypothetical protein
MDTFPVEARKPGPRHAGIEAAPALVVSLPVGQDPAAGRKSAAMLLERFGTPAFTDGRGGRESVARLREIPVS